VASSQRRPCQPRPAEGHVGDRALPHGGTLGGHVARCEDCAYTTIAYNSCRNRHCPKCQGAAARAWLAEREAELLPVPYFHVVFTLPTAIADIAYQNKAVIYDLLFKASAETVLTIAADPKHLGARVGITSVLHTWGSTMTHHPHVHMIAPGGGISIDGSRWVSCRPRFFLPVPVFSKLFRRLMLQKLLAAHKAGQLKFFGDHAALTERKAFAAYLAPLRRIKWYVYSKPPFAGPKAVLAYLSRYTHRVAIANSRLIAFNEEGVTLRTRAGIRRDAGECDADLRGEIRNAVAFRRRRIPTRRIAWAAASPRRRAAARYGLSAGPGASARSGRSHKADYSYRRHHDGNWIHPR
jgi:hypothetical protein